MGWTSYMATEYTKSGRISVSREINKVARELAPGYEFVDGSLIGGVFYSAIRDKDGNVFCAVYLTGTEKNREFFYKEVHENWGPTRYGCPDRILDMLTPTDSEWANEWRTKCREANRSKRSPASFKNLPEGTTAKWEYPYEGTVFEKGEILTLRKGRINAWKKRSPFVWRIAGTNYYVHPSQVGEYELTGGIDG